MDQELQRARILDIAVKTDQVRILTLAPVGASRFAPSEAGAHIDLHLGNGLIRSYSLCGVPGDADRHVIAVSQAENGRGGSRFIFESLAVGDEIAVTAPRNHFPLNENAAHSILIAGGIGITPLWSMIQRMEQIGLSWCLYYAARNAGAAPYLEELRAAHARSPGNGMVTRFADEAGGTYFDFAEIISLTPPGTHFYCCGPARMLDAFSEASKGLPAEQVHVEFFEGVAPVGATQGFTLELARSGRILRVEPGKTILEVLTENGMDVPHACREGVCAACETIVLEGLPDHRDLVLSKQEKAENRSMMICCSGSLSDKLVLDL